MRGKLIALELVLLILTGGLYVWSIQKQPAPTSKTTDQNQPAYPNLPVNQIKTIELTSGDSQVVLRRLPDQKQSSTDQRKKQKQSQAPSIQATMDKGPYRPDYNPDWVIESYHNYGVRKDLVKERIINPLRKLKRGELESRTRERLDEFGLDESSRRRIVLKDEKNKVIKDIVLGNRETAFAESQPGPMSGSGTKKEYIYYYDNMAPEGEFQVRKGASEFSDLPADPQEWVHKKILSFDKENVPLVVIQNNKKLFVLLRKEEKQKNSDQDNGSNSSETEWQLYSGDDYSGTEFPRNTILIWKNNQLMWRNKRNGPLQSISLTKRDTNQSKVSGLISSLSSLEANQVEKPISVSAKLNRIPKEKKQQYGFTSDSPIVYLGDVRQPQRGGSDFDKGLLLRAKFTLGQLSEGDDSSIYMSSLKTSNTAKQVMNQLMGLAGMGKSQAEKLIPVYSLSEMDVSSVLSPNDLVKSEEEKKESGKNNQSGDATSETSSSGETQQKSGNESSDSEDGETSEASSKDKSNTPESGTESTDSSGQEQDEDPSTNSSDGQGSSTE